MRASLLQWNSGTIGGSALVNVEIHAYLRYSHSICQSPVDIAICTLALFEGRIVRISMLPPHRRGGSAPALPKKRPMRIIVDFWCGLSVLFRRLSPNRKTGTGFCCSSCFLMFNRWVSFSCDGLFERKYQSSLNTARMPLRHFHRSDLLHAFLPITAFSSSLRFRKCRRRSIWQSTSLARSPGLSRGL